MDEKIKMAIDLATTRHAGQKWGDHPYVEHLKRVAETSLYHGRNLSFSNNDLKTIELSAWLHDILEDTRTTKTEIQTIFGVDVAEIVFLLTDEPGTNRKERKNRTYKKTASSQLAVLIKICDRVVNVKESLDTSESRFLKMYKHEQPEFKDRLDLYPKLKPLWDELDALFIAI